MNAAAHHEGERHQEAVAGPPPRHRRLLRILVALLVTVCVLVLVGVLGIGWYFSGQALTVTASGQATVTVEAAGEDTVWLDREAYADYVGAHGLRATDADAWLDAGASPDEAPVVGVAGEILDEEDDRVLRAWEPEPASGPLPDGPVELVMDQDVFWPDPAAVDVPFEEVELDGELGPLPAWVVPAASGETSTWAVFVHGRGGTREESLRYLPTLRAAGVTTLVPTYRNDPGAPADPDGRYGLGETEWRDVETALAHAREQGADEVLLLGWSMGAAVSLQAVDRSPEAELVTGLWLDAPVLDWAHTFDAQGSLNGLPGPVTQVAIWMIQWRGDLDFDDYDWVSRADELPDVPIHIEHSDADTFVPNSPSRALAAARPDLVTLVSDSQAEHTREWNADPQGYADRLQTWLEDQVGR